MRKRNLRKFKYIAPELEPDTVMLAERKLAESCSCCGMANTISVLMQPCDRIVDIKSHHAYCFWRLMYDKNSDYRLIKTYVKPYPIGVFSRKGKSSGPKHIATYVTANIAHWYKNHKQGRLHEI